jgi:hypothetical protein
MVLGFTTILHARTKFSAMSEPQQFQFPINWSHLILYQEGPIANLAATAKTQL